MKRILHVIPAEGLRVVDPVTRKPLTERGLVIATGDASATYWLRRLADGDVRLLSGGVLTPTAEASPADGGTNQA